MLDHSRPPSPELSVAEVGVLGPHRGYVGRVCGVVTGQHRQVGVAQYRPVRVTGPRVMRRRQPDEAGYLTDIGDVEAGLSQGVQSELRRALLVVISSHVVHSVVVPGAQRHKSWLGSLTGERVDAFENCKQVIETVIVPCRVGVASDQVSPEGLAVRE